MPYPEHPFSSNQQAEDPAEEGLKSLVAVCSEGLGQGGGLGQALLEPAGCNPMCWRLQPYVLEAATLRAGGCNPMCSPLLAEGEQYVHAEDA